MTEENKAVVYRPGDEITHKWRTGIGVVVAGDGPYHVQVQFRNDPGYAIQCQKEFLKVYRPPIGTRVTETLQHPYQGTIVGHKKNHKVVIKWDMDETNLETIRYPFDEDSYVTVCEEPKAKGLTATEVLDFGPHTQPVFPGTEPKENWDGLSGEAEADSVDPDLALAVEEKLSEAMVKKIEEDLFEGRFTLQPWQIETLEKFHKFDGGMVIAPRQHAVPHAPFKGLVPPSSPIKTEALKAYERGRSDTQGRDLLKIKEQAKQITSLSRLREKHLATLNEIYEDLQGERKVLVRYQKQLAAHNISTGQLKDPDSRWTRWMKSMGVYR